MSALHQRVRRTIHRHALCPAGSRVLVALSGGSDSVALTFLLRDLAGHGGFAVVALAHLNHRLRVSAGRDEQFCRDLAARLGLAIVIEAIDVLSYAASQRLSLEDAARRVRYEFLARAAALHRADRIAVGHTQDDQAETFLLKLMRGAGLTGLAAIHPQKGAVIRPLLDVPRAALREFLAARGESWVEDETNDALGNARSRIRHQVLPALDAAAGGPTRGAIARAAGLLREDGRWLDSLAAQRFAELCSLAPAQGDDRGRAGGVRFELDAAAVAGEPLPIRRRVLRQALRQASGGREVGLDHVDSAMAVLSGARTAADLPGVRVELRREKLVLLQQGDDTK
jgi:tRNA(Ile)-lysidine synthase